MSLQHFTVLFKALLLAHPELDLRISGTAKVVDPGNSIKYSVSLIPKLGEVQSPERYIPIFQPLQLEGFKFLKVQTLEFDTSLSLPKPHWRVQVLYKSLQ